MKIENDFIPYEQALALKELGFDEPCLAFFWNTGKFYTTVEYPHSIEYHKQNQLGDYNYDSTSAPTYSQAFRWFREKHDLFSSEVYDRGLNNGKIPVIHSYSFRILNLNNFEDFYGKIFNTYEEAELECLKKLIEIVKKD